MENLNTNEENNSQTTDDYDCLIVIPAYNTNRYMGKLLSEIRENIQLPVLIIDDGSVQPISNESINSEINIIRHETNRGKGSALKSGFNWAKEHGFSHIITLDSDLQHSPENLPDFIALDKNIDLVIGARNFSGNMPIHRRLSNLVTSFLISIRTGERVIDSQCGYRRYKIVAVFENNYNSNGFQFESEILLRMLMNGAMIDHVKIPAIYDGEKSSINKVEDTLKFIQLFFRSFFW